MYPARTDLPEAGSPLTQRMLGTSSESLHFTYDVLVENHSQVPEARASSTVTKSSSRLKAKTDIPRCLSKHFKAVLAESSFDLRARDQC